MSSDSDDVGWKIFHEQLFTSRFGKRAMKRFARLHKKGGKLYDECYDDINDEDLHIFKEAGDCGSL